MAVQSENERNKALVDEYYKAGIRGHLTSFAAYVHPDFTVTAPNYLPWGGRHVGAAFFHDHLLPGATDVFDLARFSYDNVIAEDGHVVAVFNIGVTGTDAIVKIVNHRTLRDGKAISALGRLFRAAGRARETRDQAYGRWRNKRTCRADTEDHQDPGTRPSDHDRAQCAHQVVVTVAGRIVADTRAALTLREASCARRPRREGTVLGCPSGQALAAELRGLARPRSSAPMSATRTR
jgi:ketosteroid isomerase-like protein